MLKRFVKKEIHNLYLNHLFRGIGHSLFGIFVPIYFLTLGYALKTIFIYFLILQTFLFLSLLASYILSKKFGYKISILMNAPIHIIFLLLLQIINNVPIPLEILAIIGGTSGGFYYIPMHFYFSKLSEKNKKGSQLSNFTAFGQVSGIFGPLIGGAIATLFGFQYLFPIVILFMLISLIPLLKLKNFKPKKALTLKKFSNFTKENKGFVFGTILDNIEGEIEGNIWPIFAFLVIKDIFSIGSIASLITLGTVLFTLLIGRNYDKKNKYAALRTGGILFGVLWIARAIYPEPLFIFASSLIAGFLTLMVSIPFESIFYDKASKHTEPNAFIIYREIPSYFARALIWIVAIMFFSNNLEMLFIIAGVAYFILAFLKFGVNKNE